MTYILIDEIQNVSGFEKVVDSLYIKKLTDIYITGSNAHMLSTGLATLLSGRYVEISILPFSFKEFSRISDDRGEKGFFEYLLYGGFPYPSAMKFDSNKIDDYFEGIYNTVIVRDIEERISKRGIEERRISDFTLLKAISKYLASVVGGSVSIKSITDHLISSGRRVLQNTVSSYVGALTESFIFYSAERFDIVGKKLLKTNTKLYMVDLGLRNHILPRKDYDLGFSIENVVYLELLRRGFRVNIGEMEELEVDFICQKNNSISYFQVTSNMTAKEVFDREMNPLRRIHDNYDKTILTLDNLTLGNYDGIKVVNLIDWLLE